MNRGVDVSVGKLLKHARNGKVHVVHAGGKTRIVLGFQGKF